MSNSVSEGAFHRMLAPTAVLHAGRQEITCRWLSEQLLHVLCLDRRVLGFICCQILHAVSCGLRPLERRAQGSVGRRGDGAQGQAAQRDCHRYGKPCRHPAVPCAPVLVPLNAPAM